MTIDEINEVLAEVCADAQQKYLDEQIDLFIQEEEEKMMYEQILMEAAAYGEGED
jgi:hypothetical protein